MKICRFSDVVSIYVGSSSGKIIYFINRFYIFREISEIKNDADITTCIRLYR